MNASADNQPCLESAVLKEYLNGSLPDAKSELIEIHVEQCIECEMVLARHLDYSNPNHDPNSLDSVTPVAPELPGFRCLALVDTGGFGIIWKMLDQQFNRVVAVKVMKAEDANRPALVRRFFSEAQICSQLSHPFIVPIHSMGRATDGRGWYSMRLVMGKRLDRAFSGSESHFVSRLQVFEKICQAVSYAHSKHVVHRDLKPQNIIVGDHGEVQVMDWGVAKVISMPGEKIDSDHRESVVETARLSSDQTIGGGLGTYPYMPPEQARHGKTSDFRSDVFSLGAILCELLTGLPPYADKDPNTVRTDALKANLAPALGRLETCGADQRIVEIAVQCLNEHLELRPPDASAVNRKVKEFLMSVEEENEAVRIENEKQKVQFQENRKKRRLWIALFSMLLVALGVSTAAFLITRAALKRGNESLRTVQSLAASNETLAEHRREVLEFLTTEVFGQANPHNERNREISFREVLDNATVAAQEADLAPTVKAEILTELGKVYFDLSEYGLSEKLFSDSFDVIEPTLGTHHPAAMTALDQKAMTLMRMERFEDAEPILLQVIELQNEVLGPDHEDSIHSQAKLGDFYMLVGDYDRSIEITRDVLARRRRLWGDEYQFTLVSLNGLALALMKIDRFEEASTYLREAFDVSRKNKGRQHPSTLAYMNNLALALMQTEGGLQEASDLAEESLRERRLISDPKSNDVFSSRHTVARVRFFEGGDENFLDVLQECESLLNDFVAPSVRRSDVLILRGRSLLKLGRTEGAHDSLMAADKLAQSILGEDNFYSKKARKFLNQQKLDAVIRE